MDYDKVVAFHGHSCPGLTVGYRAAKAAAERFAAERAQDEELVAIVESDGCGIDAVQAFLGCTIGKGNLIYKDMGKQVYTIASRNTGKALRIAFRPDIMKLTPEQKELRDAVYAGDATPEQETEFRRLQEQRIERLMAMDENELFSIKWVELKLPTQARIFNTVQCAYCGENVMEPRARIKGGQIACMDCAETYTRGW
ncbi:MAG: FmdE family protein [Negativicutes bacterium]|nr:FmdE family protein [Negativicutes bacterium]